MNVTDRKLAHCCRADKCVSVYGKNYRIFAYDINPLEIEYHLTDENRKHYFIKFDYNNNIIGTNIKKRKWHKITI